MDIPTLQTYLGHLVTAFHYVPGSAIIVRYIRSSYQNDPVRSAVELFLFLFAIRYLLAPKYSVRERAAGGGGWRWGSAGNGGEKGGGLMEDEIDELVEDWTPEPLVADVTEADERENESRPVIVGPPGPKVTISIPSSSAGPRDIVSSDKDDVRTAFNLASYNFYNLLSNDDLKTSAIRTLRTYGVGPCGPPGFYGTQDVHMRLEAAIAAHLGTTACIVYAQAFSTISSVIPAFSKRGDIIVADKALNYAGRRGIQISRSTVKWFEHNDMADLERVLDKVTTEEKARKRPLTRRFIVAEGLSEGVGDLVDLKALIRLKNRYKFRLILDESFSYGVLGSKACRGATEHFNIPASEIDMIIGSLAGPLCAGGGFCAGSLEIIEHQRISAAAYTFSAALPGMLATMATEVVGMLSGTGRGEDVDENDHDDDDGGREKQRCDGDGLILVKELRNRIEVMRRGLSGVVKLAVPLPDDVEDEEEEEEEEEVVEENRVDDDHKRSQPLMRCTSALENPILIMALQRNLVKTRGRSVEEEECLLQDIVDEVLRHDVLITRVKRMPPALGLPVTGGGGGGSGGGGRIKSAMTARDRPDEIRPALKVCVTVGLTDEETSAAAEVIRGAITRVLGGGSKDTC